MKKRLAAFLTAKSRAVAGALEEYIPSKARPAIIYESMRYSVFAGGKRLRPALVLGACELVGGREETALPAAAAVEMVHAYSLIHDDLPAMDDDDFRRGKPSNHKVFGEGMAILAGDALLTLAFETIVAGTPEAELASRLVHELASAAGARGMVGGQAMDLAGRGKRAALGSVRRIHRRKTAALIAASVRMGAIAGAAARGEIEDLTAYGENLGMAFQITDDVLDVEGEPGETGKSRGKDEASGTQSFPAAVGLAESRRLAREHSSRAVAALGRFGHRAAVLADLADFASRRRS